MKKTLTIFLATLSIVAVAQKKTSPKSSKHPMHSVSRLQKKASALKSNGPKLENTIVYLYEEGRYWLEDKYDFTYNSNDQITHSNQYYIDFPSMVLDYETSIDYNSNGLVSKSNFLATNEKDKEGNLVSEDSYSISGWGEFQYDSKGNINRLQSVHDDYDFETETVTYDTAVSVFEYEYDSHGRILQIIKYTVDDSEKTEKNKEIYEYGTNGKESSVNRYEYSLGEWVNDWKTSKTYNSDDKLSHIEGAIFEGGTWVDEYAEDITYDKNGNISVVETDLLYEGYLYKIEFTYDLSQQRSLSDFQMYLLENVINIDFMPAPEYYTSMQNLVLKCDYFEANYGQDSWDPYGSIIFDYENMEALQPGESNSPSNQNTTTAIIEETKELAQICNGSIKSTAQNTPLSVSVFTTTGTLVEQETFCGQYQLSGLTPGLYIVNVKSQSARQTLKIAIE